jgi:hypothetical protein
MKSLSQSDRGARRLLAAAGAVAITAAVSGVALAADASRAIPDAGTVIKGCFDSRSGALRVLTPRSSSCGSERKISWNQTGPAGNGYAFKSTPGTINTFGEGEANGPVVTKAGTYFVNVNAQLNIAPYTSGGSGFCALDVTNSTDSVFVFEIFSAWDYPAPASNLNNSYPFASSGMVPVTARRVGDHLLLVCFDSSFNTVPVKSATWIVSPVSATSSATVRAVHQSTVGPAGFRPKPPRKL